jgi:bifunctional oligoribonuclease and PAP phosphatase NrnA
MHYIKDAQRFGPLFWNLARRSKNILIASHKMPDDDSIASVLALYWIVKGKFPKKNIRIIYASPVKGRWNTFEGFERIEQNIEIANEIDNFDMGIFLDGNYFERYSSRPEIMRASKPVKICIDHHASKADKFDLSLIAPQATSTSELLYFAFLDSEKKIKPRIARALLLGLIGDTGNFRFINPGNAHVLRIAERLVRESGVNIDSFMAEYSGYSERTFRLIGEFVKNSSIINVKGWPPFLSALISREFLRKEKFKEIEVESAANIFIHQYTTALQEAEWGIVLYPLESGRVKIGLRSRPRSVNVRLLMEQMGIGSGHDHASGGIFKGVKKERFEPEACLAQLEEWMRKNKARRA